MNDALRAARVAPEFLRAASVVFVEVSPVLRQQQQKALAGAPVASVDWVRAVRGFGAAAGPIIVIANEFFDALPIRQLVREDGRWTERCVGLNEAGDLAFGAAPGAINPIVVPERLRGAADGSIVELAPARSAIARLIGERIRSASGAALVIDYGFEGPAVGDTLQAVKRHAFADVLAEPGTADVTSHVDFAALGEAFTEGGAAVTPLAEQGAFLLRLGVEARIAALKRSANAPQAEALDQALQRLTGARRWAACSRCFAPMHRRRFVRRDFRTNDSSHCIQSQRRCVRGAWFFRASGRRFGRILCVAQLRLRVERRCGLRAREPGRAWQVGSAWRKTA